MEEITHHHHSSSNKLEEPTTTTTTTTTTLVVEGEEEIEKLLPTTLVVEGEEEVEKLLPTTLVVEGEEEVVVVTDDDDDVDPIAEMEKILNYRFRNKNLLNEALSQCDKPRVQSRYSNASLAERMEFQRLEFLGDAALGLAVASFIFLNGPNISFAELYMKNTNNEKLARVAIQHGFYRYIRGNVRRKVIDFALVVQDERNGVVSSGAMKKKAPKLLADLVESIAAAIYVDCDFDLKLFWKCFGGVLEPCLTPTILYLPEKKRKRETGSEVSAEKAKGDMAINEKLVKKSNKLVRTKKRKMEYVSEVSADKVMVDIAINEKLEKKTKKENGGDVSAEKVEQLLPEENSSMKNITSQSNIQAPIYTSKHMNTNLSSDAEVEEILSYRFRNKSLLEEALTHFCYINPNYKGRLEFLGGIVLSLAVSNFLFITYPDLEPHQLTALRDANMGSEKLARVAIRHGFCRYIRGKSPVRDAKVRYFAKVVQKGDGIGDEIVKPPLILAKIVRCIAAAIFVDCEFDFKLLWKYFCGLLEPLVTPDTFQEQPFRMPVRMLFALCRKEGKHIDVKRSCKSRQHTVSYIVNGQLVGSGCSENFHIAKMTAAKEALKLWNLDSSSMNLVVDVKAKQKLNELCSKNGWQMPTYKFEKEGPSHHIKCTCEVKIETLPGLYLTARGVGRNCSPSARSAASMMLHDLKNSEHGLVKSP